MEIDPDTGAIIPDKLYFRIGEVASITGLSGHVLRFWESEFKNIRPLRSESGQRLYRKSDIKIILKIKHLLYEKKFTIPGAKAYLRSNLKSTAAETASNPAKPVLEEIREELWAIRQLLD